MNWFDKYLAWFAATGFVFFQLFLQMASTMMNEPWAQDFNLNEVELSYLSSVFFYSYIGLQIPAGILYDRYSTKLILFYSAMGLAASSAMLAYVHDYHLAVTARFLMGLGAGSGFVGLLRIIQDGFSKNKFAFMFGLAEAVGMVGVGIGIIGLTKFLAVYSWRDSMYLFALLSVISGLVILVFVKDKPRIEKVLALSARNIMLDLRTVITNKQAIICTFYAFFIISILNCFTSLWGEPFMRNVYHFDPQMTSMLLFMVFVGVAIGSPLNGWLVKKYNCHKKLLIWEAGLALIVTSIIVFAPNISIVQFFILFLIIGLLCSGYGICYALVNEAVPYKVQATAVATANMAIVSSAPILQVIVGAILESDSFGLAVTNNQNFRIAMSILPICYLISFILSFFIRPSVVPQQTQQVKLVEENIFTQKTT